jgi:hypothetical protein
MNNINLTDAVNAVNHDPRYIQAQANALEHIAAYEEAVRRRNRAKGARREELSVIASEASKALNEALKVRDETLAMVVAELKAGKV